jgi:hypothetical protein
MRQVALRIALGRVDHNGRLQRIANRRRKDFELSLFAHQIAVAAKNVTAVSNLVAVEHNHRVGPVRDTGRRGDDRYRTISIDVEVLDRGKQKCRRRLPGGNDHGCRNGGLAGIGADQ